MQTGQKPYDNEELHVAVSHHHGSYRSAGTCIRIAYPERRVNVDRVEFLIIYSIFMLSKTFSLARAHTHTHVEIRIVFGNK